MTYDIVSSRKNFLGPSYSLRNRWMRLLWAIANLLLFRWVPAPFHRWRVTVLRMFGARISCNTYVYPDVKVWAPWNLVMDDYATLGPGVFCYNPAPVTIGYKSIVSQGTQLCTASHDYNDSDFQLYAKPIIIGRGCWIAAECFVGPGVELHDGAVLGARTVIFHDVPGNTVWTGNPAAMKKTRRGNFT